MKRANRKLNDRRNWFSTAWDAAIHPALLVLISALVYLPFVNRFSYYFDDWYLMFAAVSGGAEGFREIYSSDRPGGALLMLPLYQLFGHNPLYYNLSAYVFRVLGAFGMYHFGKLLWPRLQTAVFAISLLFLIYPGFLSQPNGIVYQYYLAGLTAAMWSIALTVRALKSSNAWNKTWNFALSILLGWFYLVQIEWYIGFEVVRWSIITVIQFRQMGTVRERLVRSVKSGLPALLVPAIFLGWRLFFFESERSATDAGLQLGDFISYPLQVLFRWATSLVEDMFNVLVAAWVIPLSRYAFPLEAVDKGIGFFIGALTILLARFGLNRGQGDAVFSPAEEQTWKREMLLIGIAGVIFGLLPVIFANREVVFPTYSRYTLASSAGAAILIAAVLFGWFSRTWRSVGLSILILISALTHYGNGYEHARGAEVYRNFWWQVSWRVPQFEKNSTLVANIPTVATEEDFFIWGPANFIYYPESQNEKHVQPALFAAVLNTQTVNRVLSRTPQEYDNRRGIITYKNYRNILILSQPSSESCVHVINGLQPEFSTNESDSIRIIGSFSEIEHVLMDETHHTPPELIFGPEPAHGWCYFYQSADMARQRGEWETIINLGIEAQEKGFVPSDLIEWMPFIQAYAIIGDLDRLTDLAPLISTESYVALQVCRILGGVGGISLEVIEVVDTLYCLE